MPLSVGYVFKIILCTLMLCQCHPLRLHLCPLPPQAKCSSKDASKMTLILTQTCFPLFSQQYSPLLKQCIVPRSYKTLVCKQVYFYLLKTLAISILVVYCLFTVLSHAYCIPATCKRKLNVFSEMRILKLKSQKQIISQNIDQQYLTFLQNSLCTLLDCHKVPTQRRLV